ncbi:hypothetical protein [Halobacillus sp. BAB-2008]|uniref:hypothetical protein n=1 Tax=Halobacillus sp. BAB-2008 TaxID=1246484 RepID=UPI0002A50972|nr:hypothetical protein [Halobacillus sp. BAB-2008]ELK45999.1 hypothetical protein D479_12188 [Halobacillus sp. BAB-2008]
MLKRVEKTLIDSGVMNESFEQGKVRPKSKTMERLLDAFVVNRSYSVEEGYYGYVAVSLIEKNWTIFIKVSLFFAFVFVFLWVGVRIYVSYFFSISGIIALSMFVGLFVAPFLGLLSGIFALGWKKYPLLFLNLGLMVFFNFSLV